MRRTVVSFAALALVLWFASQSPGLPRENRLFLEECSEAKRLWEQAIAAKGGRERLHTIKNILVTTRGNYSLGSLGRTKTHYEQLYVFPDKLWEWLDDRPSVFGLVVGMYNGERGEAYTIDSEETEPYVARGPHVGETDRYRILRDQLFFAMETKWVRPVPLSTRMDHVRGQAVQVVRTSLDEYVVDFYLHKKTHLPIRVSIYQGEPRSIDHDLDSVLLSDYRPVDGIMLPHRARSRTKSYQINLEYDKGLFERAPSIEAGPDAWRPKLPPPA